MAQEITDLDTLRTALQSMKRRDLLTLAKEADVAPSTAEKIRANRIEDPAFSKVHALIAAFNKRLKSKPPAIKAPKKPSPAHHAGSGPEARAAKVGA